MRRLALLLAFASSVACSSSSDRDDRDAGPEVDPGSCGMEIYDCLCERGSAGAQECIVMSTGCLDCVNGAVSTCCPTEAPAYYDCVARVTGAPDGGMAMCASDDSACVNAACETEAGALQDCLATPACDTSMAECTGTWPESCG